MEHISDIISRHQSSEDSGHAHELTDSAFGTDLLLLGVDPPIRIHQELAREAVLAPLLLQESLRICYDLHANLWCSVKLYRIVFPAPLRTVAAMM